jgi:hypothetical protein
MASHSHQPVPPQVEPPTGTGSLPADSAPACNDHGSDVGSTTQGGDSHDHIDDPDIVPWRSGAQDICAFFVLDLSREKIVCNMCRQVFLCSSVF